MRILQLRASIGEAGEQCKMPLVVESLLDSIWEPRPSDLQLSLPLSSGHPEDCGLDRLREVSAVCCYWVSTAVSVGSGADGCDTVRRSYTVSISTSGPVIWLRIPEFIPAAP